MVVSGWAGSMAGLPAWARPQAVQQSVRAIGWAQWLPRFTVQTPWFCEARGYA